MKYIRYFLGKILKQPKIVRLVYSLLHISHSKCASEPITVFFGAKLCHTISVLRSGTGVDMKYHILHVFRTSTALKEKTSDHFKDIYKPKLLTNFDVNMKSFL